MNRKRFIRALSLRLRRLSWAERRDTLDYYTEMIQDGVEAGLTEEQAVARMGSVDEIAQQISGTAAKGTKHSGLLILLVVLGAPLWLSLGAAAAAIVLAVAAVVLSVYAVLWSAIASLYAAVLALAVCGPAGLLGMAAGFVKGNAAQALFFLSVGCACLGIGLLMLPAVNCCGRSLARFTGWSAKGMMNIFRRRRA